MTSDAFDHMTLADPRIRAHPNDFYRKLREQTPVYFDPGLNLYLVSRYDDLQTVFQDPITFSAELGYGQLMQDAYAEELHEILARDGGGNFPNVVTTDPPKHTRIRDLTSKAFTAYRAKELEPAITEIAASLIDGVAKTGHCDGMKDIAIPMVVRIICEQMGFDQVDADKINRWSIAGISRISRMASREQMLANAREICDKQNYVIAHVRDRQKQPREDMISDLVHARLEDGSQLSFEEIMSISMALLAAGSETTVTAIGNLMFVLATQPAFAERVHENMGDERWMNRFVEELLRVEPPVRGLARMTTKEVELGGVMLPKGAHMLLLFASGNDDETVFAEPRTFDPERANVGKHLAFGAGIHRCIGASLARMEIKVATREIVGRLDQIRLAVPEDQLDYLPSIATRTLASLPLTFTPRVT